jgi:hypothetical protein
LGDRDGEGWRFEESLGKKFVRHLHPHLNQYFGMVVLASDLSYSGSSNKRIKL